MSDEIFAIATALLFVCKRSTLDFVDLPALPVRTRNASVFTLLESRRMQLFACGGFQKAIRLLLPDILPVRKVAPLD